jgi:PAS domain-containing protein
MLQKLSEQVRKCHECAAEAQRKAETATDPASKASFLDIEEQWLALAGSHTFAESLSEFSSLRLQEISTFLIQEGNLDAPLGGLSEIEDFFENGAVALHLVGADGTILRPNKAELDLLGYEAGEYIGRNIIEFHADHR